MLIAKKSDPSKSSILTMAVETMAMPIMSTNEAPKIDNISASILKTERDETPKLDHVAGYDVTEDFIRASLEEVDVNSLRLALCQVTHDKELEAMLVTQIGFRGGAIIDYVLSEEDQKTVRRKALEYLLQGPQDIPPTPTREETSRLMDLFSDIPMKSNEGFSFDYEEGFEELAFEEFPRDVKWTNDTAPPAEELAKWKVTIIGAGISGLAAAISLKRLGIPFEIIERQGGIGGTWLRNNYPNVRVDSPSCLFQYRFTKTYKWKEHFPAGARVQEYLEFVANEYGLSEHIKYNREVVAAKWDETTSKWNMTLQLKDGSQENIQPNFIISGSGLFSTPNLPDIKGITSYKRPIFHTSDWDHSVDYKGKNIGLIGTGSTGTQLAPALARVAKNLTVYQRTANWIAPFEFFNSKISENTSWLYANMPFYWNWYSYGAFFKSLNFFTVQGLDEEWRAKGGMISKRNDDVRQSLTEYVQECLGDRPDLVAKMTPKHAPMVRRMVVDNGFYETIKRDNVDLVTDDIERITETGIVSKDGTEREFDMIVLGAGFKVSQYFWPVEYEGTEGMTLKKLWEKDGARSYLGLVMPNYPNLFTSYGPNHQPRAGSLHSFGEQWARYSASSIVKIIESGAKSMEVKREVYDEYNTRLDAANKKLIWECEGSGYFVNEFGRQGVNMPWTTAEYHPMIMKPNFDDFIIR
jgi:4-hydroxyacetophenone monooxygenase